jgi:glutamate-1-semialdehyde 2,1-aminomutase
MRDVLLLSAAIVAALAAIKPVAARLLLSRAKYPSVQGHSNWSKRLARLVPFYEYDEHRFFDADGAPEAIADSRKRAFRTLAARLNAGGSQTAEASADAETAISDMQFVNRYRVPFQFARYVAAHFTPAAFAGATYDVRVRDLDGREAYDLTGSYGVNLFGYDFYKECIEAGTARVRALGPVLGAYHPVIADNVRRLREISGHDEVSFHMSGTEAVMQAVRLARFHTGRTHLVRFCGAYHGWWDDVQPGVGTPVKVAHTYTLRDMDARTLRVLETRRDIACVLVNPLQALHPNRGAPGDGTLIGGRQSGAAGRVDYSEWLRQLRDVCTRRGIVLIFDEVFVGFRLAYGGAQEYFGVRADLVTYGKTLGGGLPVGVLCGARRYMKRFRDDRPSDICFARGTFNSHPYVMGAMQEFLTRLDTPELRGSYQALDETWNRRARDLNARLAAERLPVSVANLVSIWTVCYARPSRYNWMFQFYLRAEGLALSWVGTGRLIFSHNYTEQDFRAVSDRFVAAARAMYKDGWWWHSLGVSNRAIALRVAAEMLAAHVGASRRTQAASSVTMGSKSSPRST